MTSLSNEAAIIGILASEPESIMKFIDAITGLEYGINIISKTGILSGFVLIPIGHFIHKIDREKILSIELNWSISYLRQNIVEGGAIEFEIGHCMDKTDKKIEYVKNECRKLIQQLYLLEKLENKEGINERIA